LLGEVCEKQKEIDWMLGNEEESAIRVEEREARQASAKFCFRCRKWVYKVHTNRLNCWFIYKFDSERQQIDDEYIEQLEENIEEMEEEYVGVVDDIFEMLPRNEDEDYLTVSTRIDKIARHIQGSDL
jgi:hypothetical protein